MGTKVGKFAKLLVGRRIELANKDHIILDDGSKISFDEYGECCAWAEVKNLTTTDHIITAVKVSEDHSEDDEKSLTFYALSGGGDRTDIMQVVGSEGTGHYLYGVHVKLNGAQIFDIEF